MMNNKYRIVECSNVYGESEFIIEKEQAVWYAPLLEWIGLDFFIKPKNVFKPLLFLDTSVNRFGESVRDYVYVRFTSLEKAKKFLKIYIDNKDKEEGIIKYKGYFFYRTYKFISKTREYEVRYHNLNRNSGEALYRVPFIGEKDIKKAVDNMLSEGEILGIHEYR